MTNLEIRSQKNRVRLNLYVRKGIKSPYKIKRNRKGIVKGQKGSKIKGYTTQRKHSRNFLADNFLS